jgi:hypothetical protein
VIDPAWTPRLDRTVLAFVIAHEQAHIIRHDRGFAVCDHEYAADAMAVRTIERAGFDRGPVLRFMDRMMYQSPNEPCPWRVRRMRAEAAR